MLHVATGSRIVSTTALVLALTGCFGSTPERAESPSKASVSNTEIKQQQSPDEQLAQQAYDSSKKLYEKALEEKLSYYSPKNLAKGKVKLKNLEEDFITFKSGKRGMFFGIDAEDIVQASRRVNEPLERGLLVKSIIVENLGTIFDTREYLDTVMTSDHSKAYEKALEQLTELLDDIEDDVSFKGYESDRKQLSDLLVGIEVNISMDTYVAEPKKHLAHVNKQWAPLSFQRAAGKIQALVDQVKLTPRDGKNLSLLRDEAEVAIERSATISHDVSLLRNADTPKDAETVVLSYYNSVDSYLRPLSGVNHATQPFSSQVQLYSKAIVAKQQSELSKNLNSIQKEQLEVLRDATRNAIELERKRLDEEHQVTVAGYLNKLKVLTSDHLLQVSMLNKELELVKNQRMMLQQQLKMQQTLNTQLLQTKQQQAVPVSAVPAPPPAPTSTVIGAGSKSEPLIPETPSNPQVKEVVTPPSPVADPVSNSVSNEAY